MSRVTVLWGLCLLSLFLVVRACLVASWGHRREAAGVDCPWRQASMNDCQVIMRELPPHVIHPFCFCFEFLVLLSSVLLPSFFPFAQKRIHSINQISPIWSYKTDDTGLNSAAHHEASMFTRVSQPGAVKLMLTNRAGQPRKLAARLKPE